MSDVDDLKAKLQQRSQNGAVGSLPVVSMSSNAAAPVPTGNSLVPIGIPIKDADLKSPGGPSLLARLMQSMAGLWTPSAKAKAAAHVLDSSLFKVLVAQLESDLDGAAREHLMQSFGNRPELHLQPVGKSFTFTAPNDPATASALQTNLRHAVAAEGGHLLIWGDVSADGYRLNFSTAQAEDKAFGLNTRLELPLTFSEPALQVLYAASLAAMEATTDTQKRWLRQSLPAAAAMAEELAIRPSVQMSMAQQRSVQLVYGHVALAAADCSDKSQAEQWTERAITSYRSAQKRFTPNDPGWEQGLIHRHLGSALTAKAEKADNPVPLFTEAVAEWRKAADTLTRATMPQEWAQSQIKLGNALYRLDLVSGDPDLLREALQSMQGALQVYSRTETPQKWADTMHDMAQILQVYGDQLKSPDVLKKAIETCDAILTVYTQDRTPLSWAKTQNTLGSALFLFDRHKGGNEHLADAETALQNALDVFRSHGAKGPAQVAERNLAHVKKLQQQRRGHRFKDPDWVT